MHDCSLFALTPRYAGRCSLNAIKTTIKKCPWLVFCCLIMGRQLGLHEEAGSKQQICSSSSYFRFRFCRARPSAAHGRSKHSSVGGDASAAATYKLGWNTTPSWVQPPTPWGAHLHPPQCRIPDTWGADLHHPKPFYKKSNTPQWLATHWGRDHSSTIYRFAYKIRQPGAVLPHSTPLIPQ